MQKLHIKAQKALNGRWFYIATADSGTTCYADFEGARQYAWKKLKRARKEASALSMVLNVSINLLSMQERDLIFKLQNSKCAGITPRQYGYLKGIYERQERAW